MVLLFGAYSSECCLNPEPEKGDDPVSLITTTTIHQVALILPFFGIVILNAGMSTRVACTQALLLGNCFV